MVDTLDISEREKETLVKSFNSAQEAVDAVHNDHAVGVYKDTYKDQMNPSYLVFYNQDRFQKFERTLTDLRNQPGGSEKRIQLYDDLNKLAESDIEPNNLHWIYRSEWAIEPKELLEDDFSTRQQAKDDDESDGHGFDTPWFKRMKRQEIQDQIDNDKEEEKRKFVENGPTDDETPVQSESMTDEEKDEFMEKQMEEEDPHKSIPDRKEQIRAMYDNPEDRRTYQNAKDTDQFSGTGEEWMFGKDSDNK